MGAPAAAEAKRLAKLLGKELLRGVAYVFPQFLANAQGKAAAVACLPCALCPACTLSCVCPQVPREFIVGVLVGFLLAGLVSVISDGARRGRSRRAAGSSGRGSDDLAEVAGWDASPSGAGHVPVQAGARGVRRRGHVARAPLDA